MSHIFCLALFKTSMQDWTMGYYLAKKSKPRVQRDIPSIVIGFNHNYQKVLWFIYIEGDGSTVTGEPYVSPHPDHCYNVCIFSVIPISILDRYFNACNFIDHKTKMH